MSLTSVSGLVKDRRSPSTTRELNSAILGALREHGIEVPVPQRDVYIKSWPGTVLLLGSRYRLRNF
ncbi:MAG: hypothetical protein ABSH41_16370 [Syntrophobacteraceae bacterium]